MDTAVPTLMVEPVLGAVIETVGATFAKTVTLTGAEV